MRPYRLACACLLPVLAACGSAEAPTQAHLAQQVTRASVASPAPGAAFNGYQAGYVVTRGAAGITVTDVVGTEGSVTLALGVQDIEFHDARMSFDGAGNAGKAYRIYQAAFNRRPDPGGLGYWIGVMDRGTSQEEVAGAFMQSDEFLAMYGAAPGNSALVSKFYRNVLQREPDPAGLNFWVDLLDRKVLSGPAVLAAFAESPENKAMLDPVIALGMVYTPPTPRVYSADDRFAGPGLDTCRWFNWSQQAPVPAQSNGLTLSTSADTEVSLSKVLSQYSVRDSFTAAVSVAADDGFALAIPAGAQKYTGVGLYIDELNFVLLSLAHEGNRRVVRTLVRRKGQFSNLAAVETSARDVRLSIGALNGRLQFRFQDQRGWMDAGSTEGFAEGEYIVSLNASTVGVKQAFSSKFTEFTLSGTHSYRPYVRGPLLRRPDFMTGAVVESYVYGKLFGADQWGSVDMLGHLKSNGMDWLRTTVTAQRHATLAAMPPSEWHALPWNNNYWQSLEASGALIDLAGSRGMNTILAIYFSDTAANASFQDAPAEWRGLSLEQTAEKMRSHAQAVASAYKAKGYKIPIYEIGNEIEYGIANFRSGDRIDRPAGTSPLDDLDYMRTQVWAPQSVLLKAAAAGIRAVEPEAKIVLHVASVGLTPGDVFVKAFFKYMADQGVPFDIAGLSIPYSEGSWRLNEYTTDCWMGRLQETSAYLARLGKKTMVSEASYPNSPRGQMATPMTEFAFSEAGQAAWVRENLRFGHNNPDMVGFMYFYPDWYPDAGGGNPQVLALESFGLFNAGKAPRPALKEFLLPLRK